jgi:hypothetical protein
MKTETMQRKINELILTGATKLKKGGKHHLVSQKSFDQLIDYLYHSHAIHSVNLKRASDNTVIITAWDSKDKPVLIGTIETY